MSEGRRARCAVVGLGVWGRRLLAPVAERFDVVVLASAGAAGTRAWCAREFPVTPHVTGLDAALAVPDLDAVFLATPTGMHADLTGRALAAGCHVFVEKPLAIHTAPAVRVVTAARQRGLEVFIGYVQLFHPALALLRSVVKPHEIHSLRFGWWRPRLAGPIHEELLVHDLAVTLALSGEMPDRVRVLVADDRQLSAVIELPSGRTCSVEVRLQPNMRKRRVVELRRSDGSGYSWCDDRVEAFGEPGRDLVGPQAEDALGSELAAFGRALAGTGPRMVDDLRLSVGLAHLLQDVGRQVEALG